MFCPVSQSVEPSSVTSEGAVIIGSPLTHHYHLLEESTRVSGVWVYGGGGGGGGWCVCRYIIL